MKLIKIPLADGRVYGIPVNVVRYHKEKAYEDEERKQEILNEDVSEMIDWLENSMGWSDIEEHLILISDNISLREMIQESINTGVLNELQLHETEVN